VPIYSLVTIYKERIAIFYNSTNCPSTPEEAIQPLINFSKSQSQTHSLKHISRQNMTFVAKYCQFIAYLPYINGCLFCDSMRLDTVQLHLKGHPISSQLCHKASHILSSIFICLQLFKWLICGHQVQK
jgi:hypothetical protein